MWFLTFRDEHKVCVSENEVLRKIYVPKKNGVVNSGYYINTELRDLHRPHSTVTVKGKSKGNGKVVMTYRGVEV
jgi:hypothetical protein